MSAIDSTAPGNADGTARARDLDHALARLRRRSRFGLALATLMLLALAVASASLGVDAMAPWQTVRALLSPLLPAPFSDDIAPARLAVLFQLRLPRTVMAMVCGAGLAMAGVALQGTTRNPLVSPYTIGISPAAAFGASVAILLGWSAVPGIGVWATVVAAFACALACAAVVLALAALRGVNAVVLILAGVGLTYLFGAMTAALQFLSSEQQLAAIVHWTFGSLNGRTWDQVALAGGVWLLCAPVLLAHAVALDAFAAGDDDVAASLGVAVVRTRVLVTLAAVLPCAAIVSFTGVIGFVGLVAPHISRLAIGGSHRVLLPFSAVVGALLVLAADMIGRLAFASVLIPVGIVVAFIGVPLFLHLLLTRRAEVAA